MTTGRVPVGTTLAHFEAFDPVLDDGCLQGASSRASAKTVPLVVDSARYKPTARGQKGWMIVSLDDENGRFQADLVPVGELP